MSKPTLRELTPINPYLIYAYRNWLQANGLRAHLVVDGKLVTDPFLKPSVKDGILTLNISDSAVVALNITDETVTFGARFNGIARSVSVPTAAVLMVISPDRHDFQLGLPVMAATHDTSRSEFTGHRDTSSDDDLELDFSGGSVTLEEALAMVEPAMKAAEKQSKQTAQVVPLRPNPFKIVPKD